MSNKCEFCGKQFENNYFDQPIFCDKDCLTSYCDDYVRDNWRDYLAMMGVNYRE